MKTKKFLLATSGKTVDGREINPDWLRQMAKNYDPKTYGARLNIEHIRGISGQAPFRAYGDVLELSVAEDHEVTIAGKSEKRTALFGIFDVNEDAKKLNEQGQKVYPSVEIDLDFAGKGEAYLMGCALTDSPAAIGTERLTFNRTAPGHESLKEQDLGGLLEFAEESNPGDVAGEIKSGFEKLLEKLNLAPKKPDPKPEPKNDPVGFDAAALLEGLGEMLSSSLEKQATASKAAIDDLTAKFTALEAKIENTGDPTQPQRPAATGAAGNFTRTDC